MSKLELPKGATLEPVNEVKRTSLALPQSASLQPKTSTTQEFGRQLGLTGRYLLEGGGSIFDLLAQPVRAGFNVVLPESYQIPKMSIGQYAADIAGLPQPQTGLERVVGEASKTLTAVGTGGGIFGLTKPVTSVGQGVKTAFTESMPQQLVAGAGAGASSQIAEESGAGTGVQLVAGLAGGLASPSLTTKIQKPVSDITKKITDTIQKSTNVKQVNDAVDNVLDNTLTNNNIKFSDLSDDVVASVRKDVKEAIKINPNISESALKRLVDYRITGATPKQGTVTLDPALITKEKNISKLGANSSDPIAQRLARIEDENNRILVSNLNNLGAAKAVEPQLAGQELFNRFKTIAEKNDKIINDLYNAVKTSEGKFAQFDSKLFYKSTINDLKSNLKEEFLPPQIKTYLDRINKGTLELNVSTAAQLKSIISKSMRTPTLDGNVKSALKTVRDNLETVPLKSNQKLGQEALDAEKAARRYTYEYKKLEESIPALQGIRKNVSPDTYFDKYILRADTKQLANTLKQADAETKQLIKDNVLGNLKAKATNNAPDEVAKISGNQLDKALKALGSEKLKLLFTKDEIAQLKAIANVARYEQYIPRGAAVNVSNTASSLYNILERVGQSSILGRIPAGRALVGEPAQNIVLGQQAKQAQDIASQLGFASQLPPTKTRSLLAPYTTPFLSNEDEINFTLPPINIMP